MSDFNLSNYHELLEAWDAARKAEQAAQVDGDSSAVTAAAWKVAEALGAVTSFEQDAAILWLMAARWARKHFPGPVEQLATDDPTITQLADGLAAVEQRLGVVS